MLTLKTGVGERRKFNHESSGNKLQMGTKMIPF